MGEAKAIAWRVCSQQVLYCLALLSHFVFRTAYKDMLTCCRHACLRRVGAAQHVLFIVYSSRHCRVLRADTVFYMYQQSRTKHAPFSKGGGDDAHSVWRVCL